MELTKIRSLSDDELLHQEKTGLLVAGYRFVVPRGYEFEVSRLAKIATWGLYASLALVLVTERDTWWPLALFWISLALAVVAAGQFIELWQRRDFRRAAKLAGHDDEGALEQTAGLQIVEQGR